MPRWNGSKRVAAVSPETVLRVVGGSREHIIEEVLEMLWTIFVVLLILWLLGVVTSTTLGGFIHLLLIIAIAVVLIRIIQGRRPL